MAKETKIGLAVIAILLLVFGGFLYNRLRKGGVETAQHDDLASDDDASEDDGPGAEEGLDEESDEVDGETVTVGDSENEGPGKSKIAAEKDKAKNKTGTALPSKRPALGPAVSGATGGSNAGTGFANSGSASRTKTPAIGGGRYGGSAKPPTGSGTNSQRAGASTNQRNTAAANAAAGKASSRKATANVVEEEEDDDEEEDDESLPAEDEHEHEHETEPPAKLPAPASKNPNSGVRPAAASSTANTNKSNGAKAGPKSDGKPTPANGGSAGTVGDRNRGGFGGGAAGSAAGSNSSGKTSRLGGSGKPAAEDDEPAEEDLAGDTRLSADDADAETDDRSVEDEGLERVDNAAANPRGGDKFKAPLRRDGRSGSSLATGTKNRGSVAGARGANTGIRGAKSDTANDATSGETDAADESDADDEPPSPTYTALRHDTFAKIAKKLYKDESYADAIWQYNRDYFPNKNDLAEGDILDTPDAQTLKDEFPELFGKRGVAAAKSRGTGSGAALRGTTSSTASADTRPTGRKTTPPSRKSAKPLGRAPKTYDGESVYVVQEGDTLFDIARAEFGSAQHWVKIYERNQEALGEDFSLLEPGMQLVLPVVDENNASEPARTTSRSKPARK